MHYLHPDDALFQLPPLPPRDILPPSTQMSGCAAIFDDTSTSSLKPQLATGREKTLPSVLHSLAVDLHWCHRERIHWPVEESLKPSTYTYILLVGNDLGLTSHN